MHRSNKMSFLRSAIYCFMVAILIWQAVQLIHTYTRESFTIEQQNSFIVNINGTVKNPGKYRVPIGTTNFEILQVAGVISTSDLSPFNLAAQVENDQNISVGSLKTPVAVKADAKLEFFFGDLTIITSSGVDRVPQEGMTLDQGDRILTEEKAQAELSVNAYSRIDMDNFAEITFDKILIDSTGKRAVHVFQKNGACWYKITYSENADFFKCLTPLVNATVAGKGTDFTVDVKYSEIIINVNDGLLLVERTDGSDAINLISGQSAVINSDGRPIQITKLSQDVGITERFNQLTKSKADIILKQVPFNFLFCSPPYSFYLVSIQFDINNVRVIHLPYQTSVATFVQGFSTLQEAFLYGGVVFSTTLVERIISTRVPKHIVFDKDDIVRTVASIGGLKINVDEKASSILKSKKGETVLKGQDIISFLLPSVSGFEDSERRQMAVIKNIFEQIQSKNIVLSTLLIEQILSNIESNITVGETMQQYNNFLARKNWTFKSYRLPVRSVKEGSKIIYEPILEESRKILLEQ